MDRMLGYACRTRHKTPPGEVLSKDILLAKLYSPGLFSNNLLKLGPCRAESSHDVSIPAHAPRPALVNRRPLQVFVDELSAGFHKYSDLCCWLAKLMARRERGAYPSRYVTSAQRSQRLCEPQPDGAWRKGASASLPLLNDALGHRLRRGASHLPLSAHAISHHIYETQH